MAEPEPEPKLRIEAQRPVTRVELALSLTWVLSGLLEGLKGEDETLRVLLASFLVATAAEGYSQDDVTHLWERIEVHVNMELPPLEGRPTGP